MLSFDNARKALQLNLGTQIKVGAPVPFVHGYDNYTGGMANISNFNSLMRGGGSFGLTGVFGSVGAPQNLIAGFPTYLAQWVGTSLTVTGGGLTRTWVGTAITPNDVVIEITVATLDFVGTIGGYGTISGHASVSGAPPVARVVNGTITIPTLLTNMFYGRIGWGMSEDSGIAVNHQIKVDSFFDLIGNDYASTLNAFKTLSADPVLNPVDSLQGQVTGLAQVVYFAGKSNIFFDGCYFPIKPA